MYYPSEDMNSDAARQATAAGTVEAIYDLYEVDQSLRQHMLRAAAIGLTIADGWAGPKLDRRRLTRSLLLHDIGAVVRPEHARDDEGAALSAMRRKAGADVRTATYLIAEAAGFTPVEIATMRGRWSAALEDVVASDDYTLKISSYCDHRQPETTVVPLRDALARDWGPNSVYRWPHGPRIIQALLGVEAQLAAHYRGSLDDISNAMVEPRMEALRSAPL